MKYNFEQFSDIIADELNVKEVEFLGTFTDSKEIVVTFDTKITPELKEEGEMRDFVRQVQERRKQCNLKSSEWAVLYIDTDADFKAIIKKYQSLFKKSLVSVLFKSINRMENLIVGEHSVRIQLNNQTEPALK